MRMFYLLALLGLFSPSAVQAASFSCSAAQSPNEVAICGNPDLSAKDASLGLAYAAAIAGLTEEAEIVVRNGQRRWLNFIDVVCADENLRGDAEPEVERVTCLQTLYDARLRVLEQNRMAGGRRFFTVDEYTAVPDDHPRFKQGLKVVSTLQIDGDNSMAKAFNAYMAEVAARYTGQYEDFAGTTMDDTLPHEDNDLLISIENTNARRVSVRLDIFWYGHGAAHPNSSVGRFHFLVEEKRPLVVGDIFGGDDWHHVLAGLIADRANTEIRGNVLTFDASEMMNKAADTTAWSFAPAGLVVQFQDQEVVPGAPEISVPWNSLHEQLSSDAYAIAIWD